MEFRTIIKRSHTGKFHLGNNGCNHVDCNSSLSARPASEATARAASPAAYCERCFIAKPSDERFSTYYFPSTQMKG